MGRSTIVVMLASALAGLSSPAFAEGDAARGRTLVSRCSACHSLDGSNKVGPTLRGIFGRAAGTTEGYRYSKAMAESGIVWDDGTLDAFLAAPAKLIPGTRMSTTMPRPADRADIVAFLKSLPAE